jgi:hypothetical protein
VICFLCVEGMPFYWCTCWDVCVCVCALMILDLAYLWLMVLVFVSIIVVLAGYLVLKIVSIKFFWLK